MQRVIHEYRNMSRVFTLIEGLYTYVSDTEFMFDDVLWLDDSFKYLNTILSEHLLIYREPEFKNIPIPVVDQFGLDTKKEVVVCLSGGKDSAAAAYYYKKLGYTVHLYHAAGVNKAYGDEKKAAQRIADYLKCDLFIDHIILAGNHRFIEHPLKNYIIANGALHYAQARNYKPSIVFGNFRKSILDMNEFEVCGGDCIEMWDAYAKIVQKVLPNFEMLIPLETNADTFKLLSEDWSLFGLAVSCMSPYRFREHWKKRTEDRFNTRLFDNRCGCCWKDCMESMWLMDYDHVPYSEEFYLHCVRILGKTIHKETGEKESDISLVWQNYMFYPMEQSKAYNILAYSFLKYSSPDHSPTLVLSAELDTNSDKENI